MKKMVGSVLLFSTFSLMGTSALDQGIAWISKSRPVRELAHYRDLPRAIQHCLIQKSGCTNEDRMLLSKALKQIPVIMASFAAIAGITWGALKIASQPKRDPNAKVQFSQLKKAVQDVLGENMIAAVNRNDISRLQEWLSKIAFSKAMLSSLLMLAVQGGEAETARLLISAGAPTRWVDAAGNSALFYAARRSGSSESEYERAFKIIRLLLDHGAVVNHHGADGLTALMLVANAGKKELVQMLLKAGASKTVKDHAGKTAYDYAQRHIKEDWVAALKP